MMRRIVFVGLILPLLTAGCSSLSPTQVGQTIGSMAGGALLPGAGVPLGALVGTLAGMVVEKQVDKNREQKERVDLSRQLNRPADPAASQRAAAEPQGQPTRVWVDEHLDGGRLIEGHFESRTVL